MRTDKSEINFRIDAALLERWKAVEDKLPHGMKSMLLREMMRELVGALEKGKRVRAKELVERVVE